MELKKNDTAGMYLKLFFRVGICHLKMQFKT